MQLNAALTLLLIAPAAQAGPFKWARQAETPRPIFETLTGTTLTIPSSLLAPPGTASEATTSKDSRPTSLEVVPIEDTTTAPSAPASTGSPQGPTTASLDETTSAGSQEPI